MVFWRYLLLIFLLIFNRLAQALPSAASAKAADDLDMPHAIAIDELLLQAVSLIGIAYRFGGSTPIRGLDCSGFIQYIFKQSLQLNIPRTASEQAKVGVSVKKSELKPGDLVFFNTLGSANSHVGLYLGDDKFIHAPRTGKYIDVGDMESSYWIKRYNGARRILYEDPELASDPQGETSKKDTEKTLKNTPAT